MKQIEMNSLGEWAKPTNVNFTAEVSYTDVTENTHLSHRKLS